MNDPTLSAIRAQAQAMNEFVYEVGVLFQEPQRMLLRTWDQADLLKSVAWLKAKNMEGAAIYIRPFGEHKLSLIDDLKPESLTRMRNEGFQSCLVVETSPHNYQAWVNHGRGLPKALSTAAARALAVKFGGDLGSADWRHFGRMAGLTNRKEKYRKENGLFPFVRIVEASPGLVYDQANVFVTGVQRALEKVEQRAAQVSTLARGPTRRYPTHPVKSITDFHNEPKYGGDLSRADLAYAVYALGHGISENVIWNALTSRDLSKKGGQARVEDYVTRTLGKAAEQDALQAPMGRRPDRVRELNR